MISLEACHEFDLATADIPEPLISLKFINGDRLAVLEDSLSLTSARLNLLKKSSDSVKALLLVSRDSLKKVQVAIDTGNVTMESNKTALLSQITIDSTLEATLASERTELTAVNADLSKIRTRVLAGWVKVDTITNSLDDLSVGYKDSSDTYFVPLNVHQPKSSYQILLAGQRYDLDLSHTNEIYIDAKQRAVIRAHEIAALSHSFDSLAFVCKSKTSCNSNETVITCYF